MTCRSVWTSLTAACLLIACGSAGGTDENGGSSAGGATGTPAGGTSAGGSTSGGSGQAGPGGASAGGGNAGGASAGSGPGGTTSTGGTPGAGGASAGGSPGGGGSPGAGGAAGPGGSPSTGGAGGGGGTENGGGTAFGGGTSFGGAAAGGSSTTGGSGGTASTDCNGVPAEVFGHSAGTLYRVDPTTKVVTKVGDFDNGVTEMIDLALDKQGNMYGTSSSGFVRIDKTNAHCTTINTGFGYPNSLSFVPAGTVHLTTEALVGYQGSTYVEIDPSSGAMSNIGSLGSGQLSSSGDIVSVIGGGTYLTVNGVTASGHNCSDCVVKVDPASGVLLDVLGDSGHSGVYGLAFWAGFVYGFDSSGKLFSYDVIAKSGTDIPIPMAPPGLSFYGAGSTTCAPATKP